MVSSMYIIFPYLKKLYMKENQKDNLNKKQSKHMIKMLTILFLNPT